MKWFKLTTYDWYVLKKFLYTFVVMLTLFTLIIVIFDLAEKLEDFTRKKIPISLILSGYYLNFIPTILNQFSSIFVFLVVIFFTSKLAERSELIAVLSGGVSYMRMAKPYFVGAFILLFFTYLLNSWLIPITDKRRVDFETKWIRETEHEYKSDVHRQIQPGQYLYLKNFNHIDSVGQHIVIENFDSLKMTSRLYAVTIKPSKTKGKWTLTSVTEKKFNKDGSQELKNYSSLDTVIKFNPKDFFRRNEDVNSFNNAELRTYIKEETERGAEDVNFYITESYRRYSAPFAVLLLTLVGFSVSARKSRGGVGVHLGKGILISFLYLFLLKTFVTYGAQGSMPPLIAVWIPNVIFGLIAWRLMASAPK